MSMVLFSVINLAGRDCTHQSCKCLWILWYLISLSLARAFRPYYLKTYIGRPSPLFFAERISNDLGGPKIYFKRDELNHTGAHKINNCMGQILLAKKMGKTRIIAETGAGQHGVATATVCALLGLLV